MSEKLLVPSIEHRLAAVIEMNRRRRESGGPFQEENPAVTISREFGCEAFPVAERLKALLEAKTKRPWVLMEKVLLERLARENDVEANRFDRVGDRNPFFDDLVSVLSPHWRSNKDYYAILCRQIADLAEHGNIIFVGRGCSILLKERKNTYHFRMVAPLEFRVGSIGRRLNLGREEAAELVQRKQEQREAFIKDFLNADSSDPYLYHLILNNARNPPERVAEIMGACVPQG